MKTARAFVLPGLLGALAVLAALVASDVRSWNRAVESGDALYAAQPASPGWEARTRLPSSLAEQLLGAGDDVEARRALQRFRATVNRQPRLDNAIEVNAARAQAESALAGVSRSGDRAQAAQALTLLGVLAFGDFARGGGASDTLAQTAVSSFDGAVRIDPTDEAAKYDLELALRALVAHGVRVGRGAGGSGAIGGRRGAGSGLPGHGY